MCKWKVEVPTQITAPRPDKADGVSRVAGLCVSIKQLVWVLLSDAPTYLQKNSGGGHTGWVVHFRVQVLDSTHYSC
jgi:hypothetical protein